jgi:hypothetical protein
VTGGASQPAADILLVRRMQVVGVADIDGHREAGMRVV